MKRAAPSNEHMMLQTTVNMSETAPSLAQLQTCADTAQKNLISCSIKLSRFERDELDPSLNCQCPTNWIGSDRGDHAGSRLEPKQRGSR